MKDECLRLIGDSKSIDDVYTGSVADEISGMVEQLSPGEQKELLGTILSNYPFMVVDGKYKLYDMEDDFVKNEVISSLKLEFPSLFEISERSYFTELGLKSLDICAFSEVLVKEFDLEDIPLCQVMQWQTVKDIVCTIKDGLKVKPQHGSDV